MKDVARAAGLSQPTVSRALQNHPAVKEATRLHVQEVAAKLNYRPNSLVSVLMAGLKGRRAPLSATTIAFVSAYPQREGWRGFVDFNEYYEGAIERAASQGYTLEHFWLKDRGMNARRLTKILETRAIQGVLVAPLPRALGHLSLDWSRFASVALGYTLTRPNLPRATNDQYQTIILALRNLRRYGYHKIGFVMESYSDARVLHRWVAGYLAFRMDYPALAMMEPTLLPELTESNIVEWYKTRMPDAILASDSRIIGWLNNAGIKIPGDVAFASLSVGSTSTEIAGMNQNSRLVGAAAIDMIVGQLHRNERGVPLHPRLTLIPATWVDGPTVPDVHADKNSKPSRPKRTKNSKAESGKRQRRKQTK